MPIPKRLEKTVKRIAKSHKRVSKRLFPYSEKKGDAKLYLLKVKNTTKKFEILAEIDAFNMYDDDGQRFRNATTFEVATTDLFEHNSVEKTFYELCAIATHIAIEPLNKIYSIQNADETTVILRDWTYKITGFLESDVWNKLENV